MSAKKRTRRGLFIVLEGIDGSGTTTQIGQIMEWMRKRGELALATAQPTAGPIGSMLRLVLNQRLVSRVHKSGAEPVDPAAVALLFAADRLDHLQHTIRPALESGRHVVCDRYVLSSLAYQSLDTDLRFVRQINEKALAPDLTIFLRVNPDVAMARINASRVERDTFEQLAVQRRVAAAYDKLLTSYRDGTVVDVNGENSLSTVTTDVRQAVERLLD